MAHPTFPDLATAPGIQRALDAAHQRLLALVHSLEPQQLALPYHPGVNPPLWEAGHAAFFFEVFLLRPWLGGKPLMPGLDNVWDSFDIDHEDRWRPGVVPDQAATLDYLARVRQALGECLSRRPLTAADRYLYKYGLFHLYMHIESMTWARQTLGYPPPPFAGAASPLEAPPPRPGDARVPAGRYRIGMPADTPDFSGRGFAFDNEKPGFLVDLPAFGIARTLVSNGQFLEFVTAGGYRNPDWWSWGGRKWLRDRAARDPDPTRPDGVAPEGPIYWKREGSDWRMRHFDRWLPLDPAQPVLHVSFWEAEAYCNWAGRRLPTEFEWEAAALGLTGESETPGRPYPWGDGFAPGRADLDIARLARPPVGALAAGDSPFGCRQMLGTCWEWTGSQFLPYPGFTADMYPYMSTLQFGYHKTVKGGSWATAAALIRGSYRQAYLPQRRDVFVGFRTCAKD
ncbi:MAG: selenoneine synthase SenA [Pseudomonadota bacterium]